jgi:hypothetical protein
MESTIMITKTPNYQTLINLKKSELNIFNIGISKKFWNIKSCVYQKPKIKNKYLQKNESFKIQSFKGLQLSGYEVN